MKIKIIRNILFFSILFSANFVYADDLNSKFLFDSYKNTDSACATAIADNVKLHLFDNANSGFWCLPTTNSMEYNILKAEMALQDKKYDTAEMYLKESLEKLQKNKWYSTYGNEFLLYNQLARLAIINKDYKRALEYSDKAFKSTHLEKEFIETRIYILKNYPLQNPRRLNLSTVFSMFGEDEFLYDKFEDWEKILNGLSEIDKKLADNSKLSFGEQLSITKKQQAKNSIKTNNVRDSLTKRAKYELPLKYYDDASSHIKQAIDLSNDKDYNFELYMAQVEILLQKKDFENTQKLLSQMLNVYNNDDKKRQELYCIRTYCYIQQKKYDYALDDIIKAINLNPSKAEYYDQKGRILLLMSRYDEAIEAYNKAFEVNKDFVLSKNVVLAIAKTQNNYKKALSILDKFGSDKEFVVIEKVNVIDVYLINQGKYKEALTELKKLEGQYNDVSGLYISIGICYEELKNYPMALTYYKKAMNTKNIDVNAYYSRADLYIKLKKYNEALADAKQFEKLNYGDARVKDLYYKIYLGLGDYKKALQYLQEYTDYGNFYDELEQIYAMALIKAKLGDTYGALCSLNELISYALANNDTEMYAKALKLKKNIYQPAQINIIFNVFISRYR